MSNFAKKNSVFIVVFYFFLAFNQRPFFHKFIKLLSDFFSFAVQQSKNCKFKSNLTPVSLKNKNNLWSQVVYCCLNLFFKKKMEANPFKII